MTFVSPSLNSKAFACPHCNAHARQYKWGGSLSVAGHGSRIPEGALEHADLVISRCDVCSKNCLWVNKTLVYPAKNNAPLPNDDMPDELKVDYLEAAAIYSQSPRAAAALLRLCLQKLMPHLGLPGNNLNDDIGALVKRGMSSQIQQALDVVRVIGNNAVHPGELDADKAETAHQLFILMNLIVDSQISTPAKTQKMFDSLPKRSIDAIEKRDI